jgi:hypothetical protein
LMFYGLTLLVNGKGARMTNYPTGPRSSRSLILVLLTAPGPWPSLPIY